MRKLTAKQESFIKMMKSNDELAWKGFQLLLQREDFPHFFEPLQDAGFFDPETNPGPEPEERENTIRIPYWRPLGYLRGVAKYAGMQNDLDLAGKIMKGGSGVWGPVPMPANNQVSEADAKKLAAWVLQTK